MKRTVYIILAVLFIAALIAGCDQGKTKLPIDAELNELLDGAVPTETPENCDSFEGVLWGAAVDELPEETIEVIRRGVQVAGYRGDAYYTYDKDGGLIRGVYIFNESRSLPWTEALKEFLAIRNGLESEYGAPGESGGNVGAPSSLEELIEAGGGSWSAVWNDLKSSDGRRVAASLTIEWHGEIWLAFHCIDKVPRPEEQDDAMAQDERIDYPKEVTADYGRKAESVRIISEYDSITATEFDEPISVEMIASSDLSVLNIRRIPDDGCPFRIWRDKTELFGVYHLYDAETMEELDFFHPSGLEPQYFIFSEVQPGHEYIVTLETTDHEEAEDSLYAFIAALADDFPIYS